MRGITLRLYVRIQQVLARLGLKLPGKIMYIGGSDTLPPPLARDEEAELIARMDGGVLRIRVLTLRISSPSAPLG